MGNPQLIWASKGLCIKCGSPKKSNNWELCSACRARESRPYWRKVAEEKAKENEIQEQKRAGLQISEDQAQKCQSCAWGRRDGNTVFCPLAVGSCAKDGTMMHGVSAGLGIEIY